MSRRADRAAIAPFAASAALHAVVATLLFYSLREQKPVALPPMYRVNIVAAPPGERAIGEVTSGRGAPTTSVTQPTTTQSTLRETPLPRQNTAPAASAPTAPGARKTAPQAAPPP